MLVLLNYPPEVVKMKAKKPPKVAKKPEDIPEMEEWQWLVESSQNPRDIALLEMLKEEGNRISGIGSLQWDNIQRDNLGFIATLYDKTMEGEPVRFRHSESALLKWKAFLEKKLAREVDPSWPIWVNISRLPEIEMMTYSAIKKVIERAVERHNERAKKDPSVKQIRRKMTPHLARYSSTRQQRRDGVPDYVIERQKGWVPGSDRLKLYGQMDTVDVDKYFMEQEGIEPPEKEPEFRKCPRCDKINPKDATFCMICTAPLTAKVVVEMEEKSTELGKTFGELASSNPELLSDMGKFIEVIELFQENPALLKQMNKIVNGQSV